MKDIFFPFNPDRWQSAVLLLNRLEEAQALHWVRDEKEDARYSVVLWFSPSTLGDETDPQTAAKIKAFPDFYENLRSFFQALGDLGIQVSGPPLNVDQEVTKAEKAELCPVYILEGEKTLCWLADCGVRFPGYLAFKQEDLSFSEQVIKAMGFADMVR